METLFSIWFYTTHLFLFAMCIPVVASFLDDFSKGRWVKPWWGTVFYLILIVLSGVMMLFEIITTITG